MAVPKQKISKARKGKRKSHLALRRPTLIKCNNCAATMKPHTICVNCGHYRRRVIINMNDDGE